MVLLHLAILSIILFTTSFQTIELSENVGISDIENDTLELEPIIEQEPIVDEPIVEPINQCNVCVIQDSPDFFDWMEFFSNVFGIFTGLAGVYGFYVARKRGLRKRIFNSIAVELQDNANRDPQIDRNRLRGRTFFTFAFESAVNSGDFSHFSDKTQAKLSEIYQEMKIYNQYMNNLNLADEIAAQQNQPLTSKNYNELEKFINGLRKQVLDEIPDVIPLVKKEIPRRFVL